MDRQEVSYLMNLFTFMYILFRIAHGAVDYEKRGATIPSTLVTLL